MGKSPMSPSKETASDGQAAKLVDHVMARFRKSGLDHAASQYVLEHESVAIADVLEADFRRRVEARVRAIEPHVLQRQFFNPESFLGQGWKIDEGIGQRSGSNLDAGRIVRQDYLRKGESYINGEERLKRIKKAPADVQLDADDFLALWQEEGHATLKWLYDTKGITWLSFWGTILRHPFGDRCVLGLSRGGDGSWCWDYVWLDSVWDSNDPAAVLASI